MSTICCTSGAEQRSRNSRAPTRIASNGSGGCAAMICCAIIGHQIALDIFVHGGEQPRLVVELVIQRAPRHPGSLDDRLRRYVGKALVGEQLSRGTN